MAKFIKACKIICIAFAVCIFADFMISVISNVFLDSEILPGGYDFKLIPVYYVPAFFRNLLEASVFYLVIIFIEKWCAKNGIE